MSKTPFDYINDIINDIEHDSDLQNYNQYHLNKLISSCKLYIFKINEINYHNNLSNECHYNYLKSFLPKRKQYFKYFKKQKSTDEELKNICKYYEIGIKEARLYTEILTKEQIQKICDKFRSCN